MIEISDNWRSTHPGAAFAVLAVQDIHPPGDTTPLTNKKDALQVELHARYQGMDRSQIRSIPQMQAYSAYYKRFKKTYHLLLQLESIAHKNKSLPGGPTLVQVMFMAELNSLLLTAGHDLARITPPIYLDSSRGDEVYTLLRGDPATCKQGDMVTRDQEGVFCSVIYGQDYRTRITKDTQDVIYTVYIPPGISIKIIEEHLNDLAENVKLAFPASQTAYRNIFFADSGGV